MTPAATGPDLAFEPPEPGLRQAAVPLSDLKAQQMSIREEALSVFNALNESPDLLQEHANRMFEEAYAAWCGAKECVSVNSGTAAFHLALKCLDVTYGDEVITVPMNDVGAVSAIYYQGARPVFVDIDPVRRTMDPEQLERAITPRTKAIIPAHLYGQAADMEPILDLADTYGIPVVEDASQAHGALYQGRKVGSLGELACFSFHPEKNLGGLGDGGALITNNPVYAERARQLRNHAQSELHFYDELGHSYRMDGLQAAILILKLRHLDRWNLARAFRAVRYRELLSELPLTLPAHYAEAQSVHHRYVVECDQRDDVRVILARAQIETGLHYPVPLHLQRAFKDLGYVKGKFPHSEALARRALSLPMFAELTDAQMERVAATLHQAFQQR